MIWDTALVYSTGKVGSTTLEASLLNSFPSVLKVHSLTESGICEYEKFKGEGFVAQRERLAVEKLHKNNDSVIVFTVSRDPIAAVVSSVFHNYGIYFNVTERQYFDQIRDVIIGSTRTWDYFLDWYPKEFEVVIGFDVLSEKLDWGNGALIFETGRFTIVVFRLENLTNWFQPAMCKLLGNGSYELLSRNQAFSKKYADVYDEFCKKVSLPKNFVDRVYASRYAKTFYCQSELEMFSQKWRK